MCFNFATEHQQTAVPITIPTGTMQAQRQDKPKCQKAQSEKYCFTLRDEKGFVCFFPQNFTSDSITAHLTRWLIITLVRFGPLLFS